MIASLHILSKAFHIFSITLRVANVFMRLYASENCEVIGLGNGRSFVWQQPIIQPVQIYYQHDRAEYILAHQPMQDRTVINYRLIIFNLISMYQCCVS